MTGAARFLHADGLHQGAPYAYAASVPAGARTVHLAGACPLDVDGHVVAPGDVVAQASACIDTMRLALAAAGTGLDDVVFVRALVASADRAQLAAVWDVVHEAFGERTPPGTLLGVTVLGWPGQLVELEAVAAVVD